MSNTTHSSTPPQRPGIVTVRSARSGWRSRIPVILGSALAGIALLSLLSMVLHVLNPLSGSTISYGLSYFVDIQPNLGWVIVLLAVSAAAAARKRAAWVLLVVYTALYLVADVATSIVEFGVLPMAALLLHSAVAILLVLGYAEFYAKVRAAAWPAALLTLLGSLLIGVVLGRGVLELFPGPVPRQDRWDWAVAQVVGLGLGAFDETVTPPVPVVWLLGAFSATALAAAVLVLFRARRGREGLSAQDESALRVLISRFGADDSLAYFATRRDKSVVFSDDGRAAIAFRVEAGVCLAAGDPIGSPASWDDAINVWLRASAPYGWVPAVMGASRAGATAYHRHGLATLELGDEAILRVEDFSLRGRAMTPVRQAVSRARRAGVQVRVRRHADVPPDDLARWGQLAEVWRGEESERGFSMALGRWGDPEDGQCLLVEAFVLDGNIERPVALLSFVPWGVRGASLDLMRRAPDAPNGTFEAMVAELCCEESAYGLRRISLNFAMFRSAFERGADIGAGPMLRAWRKFLLFLSRWWQLESLYRSNVKYLPQWSTRYLCFPGARDLPQIALAVGRAEGFIHRVGPRWNLRGSSAQVLSNAPSLAELDEAPAPPAPVPEQVRVRLGKAERLQRLGVDPWPLAQPPSMTAAELRACEPGTRGAIAGRVLAIRDFGGVVFVLVRDWSADLQVVLERERCGAAALLSFRRDVDLGDLCGFEGVSGRSRTGEPSLLAGGWRMDAKCLHPMPDKRRGITDPEARVRQRHLDLATNPGLRARLTARSAVLTSLRSTLSQQGYLEVETPILQTIHGGANARPFRTHINAYDLDLYLRIAPELFLKKLCVGGMGKIFELGRTFRNEGVDFSHNPEFTILEAYEAHADYLRMMQLCRELIQNAAVAANGACVVPDPDQNPVDISGEWPVKSLHQAVSEVLLARGGSAIDAQTGVEELRRHCDLVGVPHQAGWDAGQVVLEMYERLVEKQTTAPTFYTDFPLSVSPLTRSHRSEPGLTERWDLVAWGVELGTAYSELTDPLEQRRRLTAQSEQAAGGDPEAMELDESFLTALEYGMPPTGGLGMGVDRVVMLVTGSCIRETLPFPMVRPAGS